jgi:hypothetical protein
MFDLSVRPTYSYISTLLLILFRRHVTTDHTHPLFALFNKIYFKQL